MKKITQVSIVYMTAALLLAQPMAQGISMNQISMALHESAGSIKQYLTVENCVKGSVLGVACALIGYALWKLNKAIPTSAKTVVVYGSNTWKEVDLRKEILSVVNDIYENLESLSPESLEERINDLVDLKDRYCQDEIRLLDLLNKFLKALENCEPFKTEVTINSSYKKLVDFLDPQ